MPMRRSSAAVGANLASGALSCKYYLVPPLAWAIVVSSNFLISDHRRTT